MDYIQLYVSRFVLRKLNRQMWMMLSVRAEAFQRHIECKHQKYHISMEDSMSFMARILCIISCYSLVGYFFSNPAFDYHKRVNWKKISVNTHERALQNKHYKVCDNGTVNDVCVVKTLTENPLIYISDRHHIFIIHMESHLLM